MQPEPNEIKAVEEAMLTLAHQTYTDDQRMDLRRILNKSTLKTDCIKLQEIFGKKSSAPEALTKLHKFATKYKDQYDLMEAFDIELIYLIDLIDPEEGKSFSL